MVIFCIKHQIYYDNVFNIVACRLSVKLIHLRQVRQRLAIDNDFIDINTQNLKWHNHFQLTDYHPNVFWNK